MALLEPGTVITAPDRVSAWRLYELSLKRAAQDAEIKRISVRSQSPKRRARRC